MAMSMTNDNDIDIDLDLDYYFPPKRRFLSGLLAAIVTRLKAAVKDSKRAPRPGREMNSANDFQKSA